MCSILEPHKFTAVALRPTVTIIDPAVRDTAAALHADAHAMCFIARSVNFPVEHQPMITVAP
jgi:organic hydroperoxide reductase OsmC/OhrA